MKITFIANSYWNFYNFRFNLIKKLSNDNTVTLIAPKDEYYVKFSSLNCNLKFLKLNTNKINILSDIYFVIKIYYLLFKIKPDYIFNYTIKPVIFISFFSYFYKCKIINVITGFGTLYLKNKIYQKIFNFLYFISQKNIHKIIFQNDDDKNYFIKNKLVDGNKTKIINGSGVDTEYFHSSEYPKTKVINFLFLGRLIKEKGIIELVEAFKKLLKEKQSIRLILVVKENKNNPSSINNIIYDLINKNNMEIIKNPIDVRKYIKMSHCLVLPSYREGLSKSCLEAMSMERPILVSNVPGCKQLVEKNKNGLIFNSIDKNGIYVVLKKFIDSNNNIKKQMGKYSRAIIIKKYSIKIINKYYLELIK
tara:strand:- start:2106 stop:3194 length:1089 start_codon:yes stop_codon:yes gene_type:complete